MALRTKKTLRKSLFLLTAASAFALSTAVGYCADERPDQPGSMSRYSNKKLSAEQEALIKAVKEDDLPTIKRLINIEGVDKDTRDLEDRNSLLHLAIQGQKKSIFDFFLRVNCDVDIKNAYGETPLHEVASTGDKDMLDRLLEEDTACVNTQDNGGNTAFHLAIVRKNIDCVSSFMGVKEFNYTLKNKKGYTVVDLLDQHIQGARGQAAHAQALKTSLLCDFNVTVQNILQEEVSVTPSVQKLAASVIQQNKKFFLSYCWNRAYSTKPMVDEFEKYIKGLGIINYYRDVREEEGLGMTLGTHIENFMKNAKHSDVTVIFLNDAYLRSRNCMYEFLQVWDADTKMMASNALVIRHPDFYGLFGGPNASVPYTNYWGEVYKKLKGENVAAADRKQHLEEMDFVTKVEANMASIIHELSSHIQVEYQQLRSKGFEDVFKLALAHRVGHLHMSAQAAEDEGKESPAVLKQREDDRIRKQEQGATEAQRAEGADKQHMKERQEAEAMKIEAGHKQKPEEEAAAQEESVRQNNLGRQYLNQKDYSRAKESFEEAAMRGNADGQCNLGYLYYNGYLDGEKDFRKAKEWFEKAAAQGNAVAQNGLGSLYRDGKGVEQNYEKAREWYEKAAFKGNAYAQNELGRLYHDGKGVEQNYEKARGWYEKAADQEYAIAQFNLGFLYEEGLGGVAQDYKKAGEWYEKAAFKGLAYAQNGLGSLYRDGKGVEQNYEKAREWFQKAADQGNGEAIKALDVL
jgi:TPR repeat protein/ankyrin repeat protein